MSRTKLGILAVVVIVATRLVIGWHFYKEGTTKLRAKNWTAGPVLAQAKGSFAEVFKSLTPQKYALVDLVAADPEAEENLEEEKREKLAAWRQEMHSQYRLDFSIFNIEPTIEKWWHHREMLGDYYEFEDVKRAELIKKSRGETRKRVIELRDERRVAFAELEKQNELLLTEEELSEATPAALRANEENKGKFADLQREYKTLNADFRATEMLYKDQEQEILTVRNQHAASIALINEWQMQLEVWMAANYDELKEYFEYKKRVAKNSANPMRQEVATLEGQASKIEGDMKKAAGPLTAGIAGIWEGFNTDLNRLAVASQVKPEKFPIARPDQAPSRLAMIDKFVPWFDTIVGALLILGLFTRPAAIAAAGFLFTVILQQPPWVAGAAPTYYQAIEMFALLVLATVGAGRYAGLDFFIRCLYFRIFPPKSAEMTRYESQRPIVAETVETSERNAEPITV
jgi:uncharacterized membrane protein YphA (DoxX/SURF4 family)